MNLKTLRQILKILGDDTRLRILAILNKREIAVKEICMSLKISQPAISKHLTRLRLLRIVNDKREGNIIKYSLNDESEQGKVARPIISKFRILDIFNKDAERFKKLSKDKK